MEGPISSQACVLWAGGKDSPVQEETGAPRKGTGIHVSSPDPPPLRLKLPIMDKPQVVGQHTGLGWGLPLGAHGSSPRCQDPPTHMSSQSLAVAQVLIQLPCYALHRRLELQSPEHGVQHIDTMAAFCLLSPRVQ